MKVKHDYVPLKIGAARKYYGNKKFKKCIGKLTFFPINGEKGLVLKNLLNLRQKIEVDVISREQPENEQHMNTHTGDKHMKLASAET